MRDVKFENMEDLYNFYNELSLEELQQEEQELKVALTTMIENPDIIPRLALVSSILESRNGQN